MIKTQVMMNDRATRLMASLRATFAIDLGSNVITDLMPAMQGIFPVGGSHLAQAGLLVTLLYVSYEVLEAVQSFAERGRTRAAETLAERVPRRRRPPRTKAEGN
jgi:hypothetical protein